MTRITLTCPDCDTRHTVYKMDWNILWCVMCNTPLEKSDWIITHEQPPTTETND